MVGTCIVCQEVYPIYSSPSVRNKTEKGLVMEFHDHNGRDCRGSDYPPADGSIKARSSICLDTWLQEAIHGYVAMHGNVPNTIDSVLMVEKMISFFEDEWRNLSLPPKVQISSKKS